MNKISTIIKPAGILVALLVLSSCKPDNKKILSQRWKIEDVKISEEVPEEQKEFFNEMLKQMKEYLRITYYEDGTYEANMMGNISKGKWELSKDGKELTASDESQKPMKYKVISLTKERFEYVTDDSQSPVTFVLVPGDSVTAKMPTVPEGLPNSPPNP